MTTKENISFADLVRAMHAITKNRGFYAQRDTMLDIADIHELWAVCPNDGFTRKWHIRENGTFFGNKAPEDFKAEAVYEIVYHTPSTADSAKNNWSIIEL